MNMLRPFARALIRGVSPGGSSGRLLILTYHRILPVADPLIDGEPDESVFRAQAEFIASYLNVMPLTAAVRQLYSGTLPARAACITFDDGYRNNFEVAAPILEEHALPATFFIATGAVESGAMFNDMIIETVRQAPNCLNLEHFGLGVWDCCSKSQRRNAISGLLELIKYRPHHEREALCRDIYVSVTGKPLPSLMMSPEMIRNLSDRDFELGGHTVTHPILANLDLRRARQEIADGRDWLTAITGHRPLTFAYPNGRPGLDFLPEHAKLVKDLGFECAVSTEWSVATAKSDCFALPRLTPWEVSEHAWLLRLAKSYTRSWIDRRDTRTST